MQVQAKRPLSDVQLQNLFDEMDKYVKTTLLDESKYKYPENYPERLKKRVEYFKVKDFVNGLDQVIVKPFQNNLPSNFRIPEETKRYQELRAWFSKK